jgi:hypothetical protein
MNNNYNNIITDKTSKILTLIDNSNIYNSLITNLTFFNNLIFLPDITYLEGIDETLEVNDDITHIIINYEIFNKSGLTLHETLQFLLNIQKKNTNIRKNIEIIILIPHEDLEVQEKLQLLDINKIFITTDISYLFLYEIITNDNTYSKTYNPSEDELIKSLIALDTKTLSKDNTFSANNSLITNHSYNSIKHRSLNVNTNTNSNNPNNKSKSSTNTLKNFSLIELFSNFHNSISNIFQKKSKDTDVVTNIYKFKELQKHYLLKTKEEKTKKIKLNENTAKYYSNNLSITTDTQFIDLPISNLIQKYKKIEIILSDKEDI